MPLSRQDYWGPKLSKTITRDAANDAALRAAGWRLVIVWECELKDADMVEAKAEKIDRLLAD